MSDRESVDIYIIPVSHKLSPLVISFLCEDCQYNKVMKNNQDMNINTDLDYPSSSLSCQKVMAFSQ